MSESHNTSESLEKIRVFIENLPSLCDALPTTVPEAIEEDLIHHVITTVTGEDPWHTFNRRFDILFGEDCRDDKGRLHHLRRGPLGMGAICTYLKSLDLSNTCFMHELMEKKLTRLVQEIIYLLYVYEHCSANTLFQLTCRSSAVPKSTTALLAPVPTIGTKQKKGKFKAYPCFSCS
jgi:hypothetical protein